MLRTPNSLQLVNIYPLSSGAPVAHVSKRSSMPTTNMQLFHVFMFNTKPRRQHVPPRHSAAYRTNSQLIFVGGPGRRKNCPTWRSYLPGELRTGNYRYRGNVHPWYNAPLPSLLQNALFLFFAGNVGSLKPKFPKKNSGGRR